MRNDDEFEEIATRDLPVHLIRLHKQWKFKHTIEILDALLTTGIMKFNTSMLDLVFLNENPFLYPNNLDPSYKYITAMRIIQYKNSRRVSWGLGFDLING